MSAREEPVVFQCANDELIGVLHEASGSGDTGVLVIVGGPQYRVGSHRQFVLLARHLADHGLTTLRFDYRGMGDAGGESRTFEDIEEDIRAAIDGLQQRCPHLQRIVLFGLCDAASAALMYGHADPRVSGLVLLNPWARAEQTLAATYLRHYYLQRLLQRDFWRNLLRGGFSVRRSFADLASNLRSALGFAGRGVSSAPRPKQPFLERMLEGMQRLRRPALLVISGKDLTAAEFLRAVNASPQWLSALRSPAVTRHDVPEADHTFSRRVWRDEVADVTLQWIRAL